MSGVRVVIVGAGLMGRWHADAARRTGAHVVAIVDRDLARAERLARHVGSAKAHQELTAALSSAPSDVVHVCTPLESHLALALQALETGQHALIEKPFAPDLASAGSLISAAQRVGRLVCPVHQFLFQPGSLRTERMLPRLGVVRHLEYEVASTGAEGRPGAFDEVALEILPHGLAFAVRWLGPVTGDWSVTSASPGECAATAIIGETRVSLRISLRGRPPLNRLRVVADRGTVELDLFNGFAVWDHTAASRQMKLLRPLRTALFTAAAATRSLAGRTVRREFAYPGLRELVRRFHGAAQAGAAAPISAAEILGVSAAWSRVRDLLRPLPLVPPHSVPIG